MDLARTLVGIATAPARIGLAAADASLDIATTAVSIAKRNALGSEGDSGVNSVAQLLGIEDAIARVNMVAQLLDSDAPWDARPLAPDGALDRMPDPAAWSIESPSPEASSTG